MEPSHKSNLIQGMYVIKRNKRRQPVLLDKIVNRIRKLCYGLNSEFVDPVVVAQKVVPGLFPGVTTSQLDELAAETAFAMSTKHPDYGILAARIAISDLHKNTASHKLFSASMTLLYNHIHPTLNEKVPLLAKDVYAFIMRHKDELDNAIVMDSDYSYDYFGFQTLVKSKYLLRIGSKIIERIQHLLMRIACGLHYQNDDIELAIDTYHLLRQKYYTHATPTLYHAGTENPQLSSCFLMVVEDSIDGIYEALKQTAQISKGAGGIGFSVHAIRSAGSYIRSTNGASSGLVPLLRVYNETARYVDQSGRRKGSFAVYIEPWHADIFDVLELRRNTGPEERRARDLFYALWIPDLFMKRVEANDKWSLMCPNEAKGLYDLHSDAFDAQYEEYERQGKVRKVVRARALWQKILESQSDTGTPYMLYKDAANRKSNQQHLGTIRSSNLCAEIIQFSSVKEVSDCNLASISLPMFVQNRKFNFKLFETVVQKVVVNMNRVIDISKAPLPQAALSNELHRPLGIGVSGLYDTFILCRLPYESDGARQLNKDIFETMYFAALTASNNLSKKDGAYSSFKGSPASKGILQFDMWNVKPSDRHDWTDLKQKIVQDGLRNSLLIALMPTATTAQIIGNTEGTEPVTSNLYSRRTKAGTFTVISKYLVNDLIERGLWNKEISDRIIAHGGSVQNIAEIPDDLKSLYKTAWEMNGRIMIDMSADRGAFVCQSQSFNVFMQPVTAKKLSSLHFYAWKKGLKTGMYYLRTKGAAEAIPFTIDPSVAASAKNAKSNNNSNNNSNTNNSSTKTVAAFIAPSYEITSCQLNSDMQCESCSS